MKRNFKRITLTLLSLLFLYLILFKFLFSTKLNSSSLFLQFPTNSNIIKLNKYFQNEIDRDSKNTFKTADYKALIFSTSRKWSKNIKELIKTLDSIRFEYNFFVFNKNKSSIQKHKLFDSSNNRSFYSLFIFESIQLFNSINDDIFIDNLIHSCKLHRIGFLFLKPNEISNLNQKTIEYCNLAPIEEYKQSKLFKLTKYDTDKNFLLTNNKLTTSISRHFNSDFYESILNCDTNENFIYKNKNNFNLRQVVIEIDLEYIFPSLLIDFIDYASYHRMTLDLDRYVQIDIDDIFVGSSGQRMRPIDVHKLIEFQNDYLNMQVFNSSGDLFKFNLGYSGHYFSSGDTEENLADSLLIGKHF